MGEINLGYVRLVSAAAAASACVNLKNRVETLPPYPEIAKKAMPEDTDKYKIYDSKTA